MNTQPHNPFIKDTAVDTFDAGINGLQLLRSSVLHLRATAHEYMDIWGRKRRSKCFEAKFDLYEMQHFNDEVKQLTAAIATIDVLQNSSEAGIELLNHLVHSLEAQIAQLSNKR